MLEKLALFALLSLTFAALSAGFSCPSNQYLYTGCSTCFWVAGSGLNMDFGEASDYCASGGGKLIGFNSSEEDIHRLSRYLEGLGEEEQALWVGLRYTSEGAIVDADGVVNSVVADDSYFAPGDPGAGDDQMCIGIQVGKFFSKSCSALLRFICTYEYSVPMVTELLPSPGTIYVRSGSNFTLTGLIPGSGVAGTEWRLEGAAITDGQNGFVLTQHLVSGSQVLRVSLEGASFDSNSHSGFYQLAVNNPAGTAVVGEWLVQEAVLGSLTYEPNNLTIGINQIAGFECHAPDSLPPARVTWFKDSARLQLSNRVLVSQETGTLFIHNLTAEADAGSYHCMLENIAGTVSSRLAYLTVTATASGVAAAETYIPPRNQSVALGQPFFMQCMSRLHGVGTNGSALIGFFLKPNHVDEIQHFTYPADMGIPELRIEAVSLEEDGNCYACTFRPVPPMVTSYREASLTVYAAAFVDRFWTEVNGIPSSNSSRSIPMGSDVIVHCESIGRPEPDTAQWYRNEILLPTSGSVLKLRNVRQSAVIQCRVVNQHGSGLASVFLCVEPEHDGIPEMVSFRAEPDSNSSIYVEWNETKPNTDPLLLRYEVMISGPLDLPPSEGGPGNFSLQIILLADVRTYIITGLEPNAVYEMGVVASSLEGRGQKTEVDVFTFPNVPDEPIPADDICAKRTPSNTDIVVEWEPFLPTNQTRFPVAGYQVEYRVFGSSEVGDRQVVWGEVTEIVIAVVTNADSYEVRVRVVVQTRRQPAEFSYGPWSTYQPVNGVTTAPPTTPPHVSLGPVSPGSGNPTGLLLIIVGVPVGVVLLLTMAITTMTIFSCWYRRRPEGQYTVTDSERIRKTAASFESSSGSNAHPTPPTTSMLVLSDQTDAGTTPTTSNQPTRFGVTVSVVDTTSVELDQPQAATSSLREEFDHLENLVSTLNETVTSMTGGGVGASRNGQDGSDTSIVINNSGAFPEYAVVRKSQLVAADCGASYAVHLASRDNTYYSSPEGSPPPLPRPFDTESEGSDTSIVKQNLVALFSDENGTENDASRNSGTRHLLQSHSYSRNTHTGSDCSMSTAGPGSGFHSTGTLEGSGVINAHTDNDIDGIEYESLPEVLKYGNSADLTMV